MKEIKISTLALLKKTQELVYDGMEMVCLSIVDAAEDQGELHPAFLHFEAIMPDGSVRDYESLDEAHIHKTLNAG